MNQGRGSEEDVHTHLYIYLNIYYTDLSQYQVDSEQGVPGQARKELYIMQGLSSWVYISGVGGEQKL